MLKLQQQNYSTLLYLVIDTEFSCLSKRLRQVIRSEIPSHNGLHHLSAISSFARGLMVHYHGKGKDITLWLNVQYLTADDNIL